MVLAVLTLATAMSFAMTLSVSVALLAVVLDLLEICIRTIHSAHDRAEIDVVFPCDRTPAVLVRFHRDDLVKAAPRFRGNRVRDQQSPVTEVRASLLLLQGSYRDTRLSRDDRRRSGRIAGVDACLPIVE